MRCEGILSDVGGFLVLQSPERAPTADLFVVIAEPQLELGKKRSLLIAAYRCKNWDSGRRPSLSEEVDKAGDTLRAIMKRKAFSKFSIVPFFVLVFDDKLQGEKEMAGFEVMQLTRDMARRLLPGQNQMEFRSLSH